MRRDTSTEQNARVRGPGWARWVRAALGVAGLVILAATAVGQAPAIQKLTSSTGESPERFGESVAIDGDVIVAGAIFDDTMGYNGGSANVFRRQGARFVEEQELLPDGAAGRFGQSVAVSGDWLAVGAYRESYTDFESGAVYVYHFDGAAWNREAKLVASDTVRGTQLGNAVAMSGDVLLAGAANSSAAYVFRRDPVRGWEEEQKLFASGDDSFGNGVGLDGNLAVVGAPWDDDVATNAGAVYAYRFNGTNWIQEQKLVASDGDATDHVGHVVSVSGNVIAASAPHDEHRGYNSGSAYVFRRTAGVWSDEKKLLAPDGVTYDYFGTSIATSGSVIFVGAPATDDLGTNNGSIYCFVNRGSRWVLDREMVANDGEAYDNCGEAVAVDGQRAVAGAHFENELGTEAGAAYVFRVGLDLVADPDEVLPGTILTLSSGYSDPGAAVFLAITRVNGGPYWFPLLLGSFAADHQFVLSSVAPTGLTGMEIGFTTFKIGPFGGIVPSNLAPVTFL